MNAFAQEREHRTIVIVEDDVANAEVLTLLLQAEGRYDVLTFQEGAEVLASLDILKEKRPALFLLDYQLSGMTALQLYEQLQKTPELQNVPALVVSASAISEEQQERLHRMGLLLLQKPYNIDDLLTTVDQVAA